MPDTLTIIASFVARTGDEDRLREALEAMIDPTVAESGCLAYQPYVDPSRPGRMVLVEEWTGSDALDLHFTTPHFKHVASVLDEILAEPFTLRRLASAEQ